MKTFWIIGAGRFGALAYQRLSQVDAQRRFTLVDRSEQRLLTFAGPRLRTVCTEGIAFMAQHLGPEHSPDWIIPSLPVHLAAEWLQRRFGFAALQRIDLPDGIQARLPHCQRGAGGDLYTSYAGFRCPDSCDEPDDICTITLKQRGVDMYRRLAELKVGSFSSLVIRSHQLVPGVGGYRPVQLMQLAADAERCRGPMLVSTACRCHAVISPFRYEYRRHASHG
jgi:hypothetical protein